MKKILVFGVVAVLLSAASIGCTTTSGESSCRLGSLWSTSRTKQEARTVYTTSAQSPVVGVSSVSACNPCEPAACSPCEPVCNPCDMSCTGSVITGGITPHPAM